MSLCVPRLFCQHYNSVSMSRFSHSTVPLLIPFQQNVNDPEGKYCCLKLSKPNPNSTQLKATLSN